MKVVSLDKKPNQSALALLEDVSTQIKEGEIVSVSVSFVAKNNVIGCGWSDGPDDIMLWAATERAAKKIYHERVEIDN